MKRLKACACALGILVFAACASAPRDGAQSGPSYRLEGTSWRLVQMNVRGTTRAPVDRSRYTIGFGGGGVLNVRFDCNRGRAEWKSTGAGHLEFGAPSLTRALCPVGSLHDELVREWPQVRSYAVQDGRLFLSLGDGGLLEFEPAP
jgi:heat shock protein HslJ